jgi:hypothetical protein
MIRFTFRKRFMEPKSNTSPADHRSTAASAARERAISAQALREALDAAETEFAWCLRVVGAFSGYNAKEISGDDIVGFQTRLYKPIADLEKLYRRIKREEKRLIREKARFKPHWFAKRMATLAAYSKKIRDGLTLGRAIGDGYAWFFYERDPNLIDEHLKLQPQPLLPADLGGAGERIILENVQGIDGKLLLYHGITSILRIGDITFIDLTTMRVACMGELKTSRIDPKQINISMSLIAGAEDQFPTFPISENREASEPPAPPSASMQRRFERQKKVMQESVVRARDERAGLTIEDQMGFHFRELEDVVKRSRPDAFEYVQAGEGLIIGAWRLPSPKSLGSPSPEKALRRMAELAKGVPSWAMKILDRESQWNSISYAGLGGDETLTARAFGLPFFAWPVDPDVLADIGFGRVVVITLFNSGHMIKRLSEKGYAIEVDEKGCLTRAHKEVDGKIIELGNYDFFLSLVQWALMTEDAVMSMIDETIAATAQVPQDGHPAQIQFRPRIRRSTARDARRPEAAACA